MPVLYAIPAPLGGPPERVLPPATAERLRSLRDFVAENPKSARAMLAALGMPCALREISLQRLDENTPVAEVPALLEPLRQGRALGLLPEAGCPAVADPGALLIEAAYREGFRVAPLVGPSSIVLALMASGLDGQRFAFCGYLPRDRRERQRRVRELEQRSRRARETQIFIETPYRNQALLEALLETCAPQTRLCIASDLTLPTEQIGTQTIAGWRRARATPGKRPAVFLLLSA